MSWWPGGRLDVHGEQAPRISSVPPFESSAGPEVIELAESVGVILDPWQRAVLTAGLGERGDDWTAFEVALVLGRQNGKTMLLTMRALAGLFIFGEKLILHSAHLFSTSLEAFRELVGLIEGSPDLERLVKRVSNSHGEEGVELRNGARLRYRTRTSGGAKGLAADAVLLDEAQHLSEAAQSALTPTTSTKRHAQLWYAGTAADAELHPDSLVLARIRERGLKGDDPGLAYFEWSVDCEPALLDEQIATDPENWRIANPGLGTRLTLETISREQRSLTPRDFARERLGISTWPRTDGYTGVVSPEAWAACLDADSQLGSQLALGFDIDPSRGSAVIAAASVRADGLTHIEIVDVRRGVEWLAPRLTDLAERLKPVAVVCDTKGMDGEPGKELEDLQPSVTKLTTIEYASACASFIDSVSRAGIRHIGQAELDHAIGNAQKRSAGDGFVWKRQGEVTPVIAATLALAGAATKPYEVHCWSFAELEDGGDPHAPPPPSANPWQIERQGWRTLR